jgi:RimJ/RimL family protein N-acetyltransferase
MISDDVFRELPVLTGRRVRLEPMGAQHADALVAGINDPESSRLTGTHATFTPEQIREWAATRPEHHDRADWVIVRREDERVIGELVLNQFDPDNAAANVRIAITDPAARGRGLGTEAIVMMLPHAFEVAGLHRISLGVHAFNPRAIRAYEKCGFVREACCATICTGTAPGMTASSCRSSRPTRGPHRRRPDRVRARGVRARNAAPDGAPVDRRRAQIMRPWARTDASGWWT